MEKNRSIVLVKSYEFSVKIVKLYQRLTSEKREFILSKQLLRSGTSIGANITEANGAISNADFSSKMSIAYKEALETKYWLNLLYDTNYLIKEDYRLLYIANDELCKMLFSILKTTRIKPKISDQ